MHVDGSRVVVAWEGSSLHSYSPAPRTTPRARADCCRARWTIYRMWSQSRCTRTRTSSGRSRKSSAPPPLQPPVAMAGGVDISPLRRCRFHSSKVEAAMHEVLEEALKDTNEKDAKGCRELRPKTSYFRPSTAAPVSETRTARYAGATRSNGTLRRWRTSAATLWPSVTTEPRVSAALVIPATTSQVRMRPSLHPPDTHTRSAAWRDPSLQAHLPRDRRREPIAGAPAWPDQSALKVPRRPARGAPACRRRERAHAVRRACASRRVVSGTRSTTNARLPPFPTAASTLQPSASLYSLSECAAATRTTAEAPVATMCAQLDFAWPMLRELRSHSFSHCTLSLIDQLRNSSITAADSYTSAASVRAAGISRTFI